MSELFKKLALAVAVCVPLASCGDDKTFGGNADRKPHYTIDPRTGLCFVETDTPYSGKYAFSWVPCTKEVLAQVEPSSRYFAVEVYQTKPASNDGPRQ